MARKFTETHEWVEFLEDGTVAIGITDYAQGELGDIVFIDLPDVGAVVSKGKGICDIESVKAVSEIFAPVSGEICAVNELLTDEPQLINTDPLGAWIVKLTNVSDTDELLDEQVL